MNMFNLPQPANPRQPLTMSSREIAELVEKRHDNVKRTVETLADRGVIVRPQIEDEQDVDSVGRPRTTSVYHLGKRDSFVVVAQLSPEFTARVVDRWQQLETEIQDRAAPASVDLNDPVLLLQLLTVHAGKRIEAEQRAVAAEAAVEAAKPKTNFYDLFANADGLFGLQNVGRMLGEPPNKFIGWLKQTFLFYQGKALVPRAEFIRMGIFEVKSEVIDGEARYRTWITPKGVQYLAKKLGKTINLDGAA